MSSMDMKLDDIYRLVSEKLKSEGPMKKEDNNVLSTKAQKEQEMKFSATDGSAEAREYMKNRIRSIIRSPDSQVAEDNIDILIRQYPINYFTNIFTGGNSILAKTPVDRVIEKHFNRFSIHPESDFGVKLYKLAQIIYQECKRYKPNKCRDGGFLLYKT